MDHLISINFIKDANEGLAHRVEISSPRRPSIMIDDQPGGDVVRRFLFRFAVEKCFNIEGSIRLLALYGEGFQATGDSHRAELISKALSDAYDSETMRVRTVRDTLRLLGYKTRPELEVPEAHALALCIGELESLLTRWQKTRSGESLELRLPNLLGVHARTNY